MFISDLAQYFHINAGIQRPDAVSLRRVIMRIVCKPKVFLVVDGRMEGFRLIWTLIFNGCCFERITGSLDLIHSFHDLGHASTS